MEHYITAMSTTHSGHTLIACRCGWLDSTLIKPRSMWEEHLAENEIDELESSPLT